MLCALSLYFYIEPPSSIHFAYLFGVLWFSPSPKKTHICAFVLPHPILLFFLKIRLMLGTSSPSIRSDFSHLWSYFPRRWLTINSFFSSWFSRYGFWWYDFYNSRMAPRFDGFVLSTRLFHIWSLISLQLSLLLASLWLSLSPCLPL